MTAPMISILDFPAARNRAAKTLMMGLKRMATIADRKKALRSLALPVFDSRARPKTVADPNSIWPIHLLVKCAHSIATFRIVKPDGRSVFRPPVGKGNSGLTRRLRSHSAST